MKPINIILNETTQNPLWSKQRVLQLGDDFCLFELNVRDEDEEILLENIKVPEEDVGKGLGSQGLEWIKSVAERTDYIISGTIYPNGHRKMSVADLAEFYSRHGFVVKDANITYYPSTLYQTYGRK